MESKPTMFGGFVNSCFVLLLANNADAQVPAQSVAELLGAVKVGEQILLVPQNRPYIPGRVVSITPTEIRIAHVLRGAFSRRTELLTFDIPSVERIDKVDPLWNGTLIGGAVGVLAAAAAIKLPGDRANLFALFGMVPIAAAIGHTVDRNTRSILYLSRNVTLSIRPTLERQRIGAAVNWNF